MKNRTNSNPKTCPLKQDKNAIPVSAHTYTKTRDTKYIYPPDIITQAQKKHHRRKVRQLLSSYDKTLIKLSETNTRADIKQMIKIDKELKVIQKQYLTNPNML